MVTQGRNLARTTDGHLISTLRTVPLHIATSQLIPTWPSGSGNSTATRLPAWHGWHRTKPYRHHCAPACAELAGYVAPRRETIGGTGSGGSSLASVVTFDFDALLGRNDG